MLEIFRQLLFGISPDVPTVKVRIRISDYSQSDFVHYFDFHYLINFAKGANLLCSASLWCVLLCKRPIYTYKSDQYIPLW